MKVAPKTYIDPKDLPAVEAATLRRIASYIAPHSRRLTIVITCIITGAVLNLLPSWLVKHIVDVAIPRRDLELLLLCCSAMAIGPLVAGVFQVAQKQIAETIGQDVMLEMRVEVYRHLQQMPLAFVQSQKPGEAVSNVLSDVQGAAGVISGAVLGVAQNAVALVSTLAFIAVLDWRLALLASCFLPLFIAPTRRVGRARKALKRNAQARIGELTGILTETLSASGVMLIKIFGREEDEMQRFREKAGELRRLSLQQSLVGRWFQMLLGLFESFGPALIFAAGGMLVIERQIPLGTVVAFVTLLKRLYAPASDLANVHVDLRTSYAYFDRVFDVLDRPVSLRAAIDATPLTHPRGRLVFSDVSFAYDEGERVIHRLNLHVPAGSSVGIVGPSGAGKSTIASLAARLYDPSEGAIAIDGVDLRNLTLASLRSTVTVVTQDTFLFQDTVFNNLRYGSPTAWRTEVERAATLAQIHDVICALPEGYDTVVGPRGYRLSGGERQRLAIARALLADPRIVIFDEATSALDTALERRLQDSLAAFVKGRTMVTIAHRLSTVRDADVIVVIDRGRIVESGTHDYLMAQRGLYAWLWAVQSRENDDRASVLRKHPLDIGGRIGFGEREHQKNARF